MGTLTAKLTLTSSDITTDVLNLSVTDTRSVTNPAINTARLSLVGDATAICEEHGCYKSYKIIYWKR